MTHDKWNKHQRVEYHSKQKLLHHYQHSLAWIYTSMLKISLFNLFIFWNTVNFTIPRPDGQHPFFDHNQPKTFDQLLVFVNFYHHAKNVAVSSICSREIVHLKILLSDWLRAFWPISQKLPKYGICGRTQKIT